MIAPRQAVAWLLGVLVSASTRIASQPNIGRRVNAAVHAGSKNSSDQSLGKDECHVVDLLHRKIFDALLHLRDVHTHALEDACVRYSNRSGGENQRQAEPDQDSCHNSDSVMCPHSKPPVAIAMDGRPVASETSLLALLAPRVGWRLTPNLFQGGFAGSSKWFHRAD